MQKGWRKWPMIIFILALLALAIIAFGTGCTSKSKTSTSTPISQLQTNVSALKTQIDTIDDTVWANNNDVSALKTQMANANSNLTGYSERIANLEARNCSCNSTVATCDLSAINASLTMLGLRITALELLHAGATPTASPTPTPTYVNCGVQRPSAVSPASANTSVINGTVLFEWSSCSNAVRYEFWFGSDASNMLLAKNLSAPVTFYAYPVPLPNTYYFWKIVAISPCNVTESDAWWFRTAP